MHGRLLQKSIRWLMPALAVGLVALLSACGGEGGGSSGGGGGGGPPPIDVSKLTPSCFVGGETPLIDGTAPDLAWTYNDPHVLKVNGKYWMYASSTNNFDFPVLLYRLTSTDNINYTRHPAAPILEPDPGQWDGGGVETPAVVKFKGKYHLFWTGYRYEVNSTEYLAESPFDFRIGHATSTDGVHWTRNPNNPVVSPASENTDPNLPENYWYQFIVGEPGPVVYNNKIYLYFTAVGANVPLDNSLQVVGLTTSSDGVTWSAPQLALEPDQILFPRDLNLDGDPGTKLGWVGYSTPNAIVLDGQVHLFYDVAQDLTGSNWLQIALHHSWSPDGETGWIQDETPMFSAPFSTWATEEVRSSDAFLDGQTLRFYFAGHTASYNFGIGEATCDLTPD